MPEFILPKAYDFKNTEERVYTWWEKNGYFQPANDPHKFGFDPNRKPFVISIPPPNVTGELHLGHAMFLAMEDLMIRYQRMKGVPTLWVPGSDHAGIATQLQVEKALEKEGLKRTNIGREEFIKRVWAWKERFGGIITRQIRRMGSSCDWTRERFTMDEGLSRAVREAFVRLYEKGLIYRGMRMVNWSPQLMTAVSDLEVEYSQEPGILYHFKYVLADNPQEFIPVATTRPETIPGDTAVAVNPNDERYQHLVGRQVLMPILNKAIPVVADDYVDREFGGGALKVTPAHAPNDYAIALRHNLEVINILNKDVTMNENAGPYQGLDRFECRRKIWNDMLALGLAIKEEPYTLNIPRSQRGGEIIEPMISTQWFVSIQPLAEAALKAVHSGEIKIIPENFTKVFYNWMENIQDWCISRQLWWGHRIPVWYCDDCSQMTVDRQDPKECAHCHSPRIHQDEDVLDTWFSSGLWPFSTLGWPDETPDYKYFYPTSVLETGYDILFFWVARMIMAGIEFTGKPPFHTVYLHGLIRDEKGQKMSKTKGNAIDPLTVMDELGTDALRFTLLVGSSPGNDMNLSMKKVEANRNFANKVWNAGRYVIRALERAPKKSENKPNWTMPDLYIKAKLKELIRNVNNLFDKHFYGEAGQKIYEFFWNDFADWYIEISKGQIKGGGDCAYHTVQVLIETLDSCLRLLHPFTPFVTEELWGYLKKACMTYSKNNFLDEVWENALVVAEWPNSSPIESWESNVIIDFSHITIDHARGFRNLKAENKIPDSQIVEGTIIARQGTINQVEEQIEYITSACAVTIPFTNIHEKLPNQFDFSQYPSLTLPSTGNTLFLHLKINESEKNKAIKKQLDEIQIQIDRINALLSSEFTKKAPREIVEKERQKLSAYQTTVEKLREQIDHL